MNRKTKILIAVLSVFIVAMTLGIAFGHTDEMKTFKSDNGYEWKIPKDTWENMKLKANREYNHMRQIGSITPGYSDSLNITVTKDGKTYHGIALAIKNDKGMRCEIRGAFRDGERITADDNSNTIQ